MGRLYTPTTCVRRPSYFLGFSAHPLPAFYDPLEKVEDKGPFEHVDPGHRANPAKPNLLKDATMIFDMS